MHWGEGRTYRIAATFSQSSLLLEGPHHQAQAAGTSQSGNKGKVLSLSCAKRLPSLSFGIAAATEGRDE